MALSTAKVASSKLPSKRMKIEPSGICDDAEFVRRIHLDLTGLPPTPEVVKAFLADKRETLGEMGARAGDYARATFSKDVALPALGDFVEAQAHR